MNYLSEKKSTIKTPSKSTNLADIEFPVYFGYLHCATYSELCDDCINLVSLPIIQVARERSFSYKKFIKFDPGIT